MYQAFALALLLLAAPAGADTILLDFEEEPAVTRKEFMSAECGCVRLIEPSSNEEADLRIRVVPRGLSDGQAMEVGNQGGSLLMEFLVPVVALSLDFGNDAEDTTLPNGGAVLKGFDAGGALVAQATMTPNRDLIVNQTISISSLGPIARATFAFNQLGDNEPHDFIVDNLVLTTVPEPSALGLVALASACFVSRRGAGTAGRRSGL